MSDAEALRATNVDALRRFFNDDFHSAERRELWAEDAIFEMPFKLGGAVSMRGRAAMAAYANESWERISHNRFFDVRIYETLDPTVFWVTVKAESTDKASGVTGVTEHINLFELRDGKVLHRTEYFNPIAHPS